jgi:O-methyltransferase
VTSHAVAARQSHGEYSQLLCHCTTVYNTCDILSAIWEIIVLTKIIKKAASGVGLCVNKFGVFLFQRKQVGGLNYEVVVPYATYAPWLSSQEFLKMHTNIRNNTLIDQYRLYELWELVSQTTHLPGNILEVGVWRGGSGCLLAARAKSSAAKKHVYLCDTFSGVVKTSEKDSSYVGGEHSDTTEDQVIDLIKYLSLDNAIIKKGIFPDNFRNEMENEQFCFVHIDVDVYLSAKDVMDFAWPRMPIGGIVVFDDFGFVTCDGIPKLIEEWRGDHDKVILHNLNGHAVVVKVA